MNRRFLILLLLTLVPAACAPAQVSIPTLPVTQPAPGAASATPSAAEPLTLNVFAAASLTDAFTEIGSAFEAVHPGLTINFNFAGSQALRTQIEEGAPADLFASANMTEMDNLISSRLVAAGLPQVFLTNRLVVILPADNPADIAALEDLARPGVKMVLAAGVVPVGKYARQALDLMNAAYGAGFEEKVLANVVSNEDNVKQVVAKVQLGEADAGIVYTSDAVAAPDLKRLEIPAGLNVIAMYPIAPLAASENAELAARFAAYVLSDEAQVVLQKWGFGPIP